MYGSRIIGTGSAFPEGSLTNEQLSRRLAELKVEPTSSEWIVEHSGIRERRISKPGNPGETNSSLGQLAALRALEMAGRRPQDIDQIIYATCTPDTLIPSTACWLQQKLGAKRAWAMDINAACSGFVYAMSTADQFIRSGQSKTVLVVGADVLSPFTNWEDRSTCILFGDGAGAAIVERVDASSPRKILSSHLGSDGDSWDLFHIPAGGSNQPLTPDGLSRKLDKMQMKGPQIFKVAVKTMSEYAKVAAEANGLTVEQIDWMVPHQANLRVIESVGKRLGLPPGKCLMNIERFGNTSAATVPTVLDEAVRAGKIREGQTVLLNAFGAGSTWGSLLFRW